MTNMIIFSPIPWVYIFCGQEEFEIGLCWVWCCETNKRCVSVGLAEGEDAICPYFAYNGSPISLSFLPNPWVSIVLTICNEVRKGDDILNQIIWFSPPYYALSNNSPSKSIAETKSISWTVNSCSLQTFVHVSIRTYTKTGKRSLRPVSRRRNPWSRLSSRGIKFVTRQRRLASKRTSSLEKKQC